MDNLKVTVYQGYLFWENIDKNLQNISLRLSGIREKTNLIILPEMFNTGFTMNAEATNITINATFLPSPKKITPTRQVPKN
jgi:omega-amidase